MYYNKDFLFHKSTGNIHYLDRYNDPDTKGHNSDWIYIKNSIQAINELFDDRDTVDIMNSDTFIAISKYFETILKTACSDNHIKLNKLYPIFVVPDEWKVETVKLIQELMIPILTKAGLHFETEYYRDRVLFIGELEAKMAGLQLQKKNSKPSAFIHNENRCIMYAFYNDKRTIKFKATYFQVKEDYNLRLFNDKYYSLNIISRFEITMCTQDELNDSIGCVLKKRVFNELLDMELLTMTPLNNQSLRSVADYVLEGIFRSFSVCFV
jgi:hypothetical protein